MKKTGTQARKPQAAPAEGPDVASRVAWSYLGAVIAAVVGGLLALIAYQVARPLACTSATAGGDDASVTCELVWAAGLAFLGFLVAYAGTLALLKLRRWAGVLLGTAAGLLCLLMLLGYVLQWWWWVALLLLPTAAAVASAPWSPRRRVQDLQLAALALALVAAVAGFVASVLWG